MANEMENYQCQFTAEERKIMTAQAIKELRVSKKYSQKEVAGFIQVKPATYNTYEAGRTEPPIEILVRLSHLYDTPVDIIVQRDRTYRTADDASKQLEGYKAQLAELDRQIAESGGASPEILAFRDTLEKFADAMISYSKKPDVRAAIDKATENKA